MIHQFNMYIDVLKDNRHITIYVPDHYDEDKDKTYPVLYIQDGQNVFFDELSFTKVSWGFLETLESLKLDMILVAIDNNGLTRMDDYAPWVIPKELALQESGGQTDVMGGKGKEYIDWMIHGLMPFVNRHYRTNGDNGICGSSMGGVIACYASLAHPEVFSKCASLSTAFWFYPERFKELARKQDLSKIRAFYLDLGEHESPEDIKINDWYLQTNKEMDEILSEKLNNYYFAYYEGAYHHEAEWAKRVPIFLEFLYGEYLEEEYD